MKQLLDKKDTQLTETMTKNGELKGYANDLKEDL